MKEEAEEEERVLVTGTNRRCIVERKNILARSVYHL